MPPYFDYLFHSGTLVVFLAVAWQTIKRLNRDESLKKDYPPHRHVNGQIIFPKEFEPSEAQKIF